VIKADLLQDIRVLNYTTPTDKYNEMQVQNLNGYTNRQIC